MANKKKVIDVASQFSEKLGTRYKKDGKNSGEVFRDRLLLREVESAFKNSYVLVCNFDHVDGMPTSFLEESFGGLLRIHKEWSDMDLLKHLEIIAPSRPALWSYCDLAIRYIHEQDQRNRLKI